MVNFTQSERVLLGKVAGEIVLSDDAGGEMRKWRNFFNVPPKALSRKIGVSPSVISDYEGGRIENPGIYFVKRFVKALFEFDKERGGHSIFELGKMDTWLNSAIVEIGKFPSSISLRRFNKAVFGEILVQNDMLRKIGGFIVLDSRKTLESLSGIKFLTILEDMISNAFIFVNIEQEATPMITLRFSLLKPTVLVYHLFPPSDFDIKMAKDEKVTLIYSKAKSIEHLTKSLRKLHRSVAKSMVERTPQSSLEEKIEGSEK